MSEPKKQVEVFDGPLGILPDGKLNTVEKDAPPFEPEIVDDDADDPGDISDLDDLDDLLDEAE